MKNLLTTILFLAIAATAFTQTQNGHIKYRDLGNSVFDARTVLTRTDHANLDTLTSVFTGSLAYDTINEVVVYYNGVSWVDLDSGTGTAYWQRDEGTLLPITLTDSVGIGVATPDEIVDRLNVKGTVDFTNDSSLISTGRTAVTLTGFPYYVDGVYIQATAGDTVSDVAAGSAYADYGGGFVYLGNIASIKTSYDNIINAVSSTPEGVSIQSGNLITDEGLAKIRVEKDAGVEINLRDTGLFFLLEDNSISQEYIRIDASDSTATFKTLKSFTVQQPLLGENWLNWTTSAGGTTGQISSSSTLTAQSTAGSVNVSSGLAGYINFEGAYNFPKNDGLYGQNLTTDGAGNTYWKGGLGWVTYVDTTYPSSGSAWTLTGGADTKLDFSWGTKNDTYLPSDIDSLFNRADSTIIGINGMGVDIMLYFKAIPSAPNQWLDIWIDIGGTVGELYRQTFSFPKGAAIERGVMYALPAAYTLNTWEANGGTIYVASDANLDIHSINLNINIDSRP